MSDSIKRHFYAVLVQQNRGNYDILEVIHLPKMIQVRVRSKLVNCRQILNPSRIIMVTMNRKDRHLNPMVFVCKIGLREIQNFEGQLFLAENLPVEDL